MLRRMNNRKGFTLIELMIVVAIVGILAAIGLANHEDGLRAHFLALPVAGVGHLAGVSGQEPLTAKQEFLLQLCVDFSQLPVHNHLLISAPEFVFRRRLFSLFSLPQTQPQSPAHGQCLGLSQPAGARPRGHR